MFQWKFINNVQKIVRVKILRKNGWILAVQCTKNGQKISEFRNKNTLLLFFFFSFLVNVACLFLLLFIFIYYYYY